MWKLRMSLYFLVCFCFVCFSIWALQNCHFWDRNDSSWWWGSNISSSVVNIKSEVAFRHTRYCSSGQYEVAWIWRMSGQQKKERDLNHKSMDWWKRPLRRWGSRGRRKIWQVWSLEGKWSFCFVLRIRLIYLKKTKQF